MSRVRNSFTIQSVERAIAILRAFTLEKPERGVNELSRELELHKSTASRLMITLEQGGLLARDPETERYRLGLDLIGLAAQVTSYMDVREIARRHLAQLAEICQETVNLAVLDAGRVINLEQIVSPTHHVKNSGLVGPRMYPHCTAAGKVLLAHLTPGELGRVLDEGLPRFTARTITDPQALRRELAQVCEQGYAIAQEELEDGLNAIAAPVYDHTGQVRAAVSMAGPAYRITPEQLPRLALPVVATARSISAQLGYRP